MQIQIQNGRYGNNDQPNHIILIDLPRILGRLGYPLAQVEIGKKKTPVIVLEMKNPRDYGTIMNVPIDLVISPYTGRHRTLNAQLQFDGLKDYLGQQYGVMGRYIEFTMRVRLLAYRCKQEEMSPC